MHLYAVLPLQHFLLQQVVLQHGDGPQQLGQHGPAALAGDARKPRRPEVPDATATKPKDRVDDLRGNLLRSIFSARRIDPGSGGTGFCVSSSAAGSLPRPSSLDAVYSS